MKAKHILGIGLAVFVLVFIVSRASKRQPEELQLQLGEANPAPAGHQTPAFAHTVTSDGSPVAGAPEPEVVQLRKIEAIGQLKHVTVGNVAGDYILVCNLAANKDHAVKSCLSPRPQTDYLLFKEKTQWTKKGAKDPISLSFMEDFSVSYNDSENIGLLPAKDFSSEAFGVYRLLSWTAARPSLNQNE
jgi:hypothetical protein